MREQPVGDPVQRHQIQRGEVEIDQFPQRATLLQPVVGGQFAARCRHAPNQAADGRGALRTVEAQRRQLLIQTDLAQRRQGDMLHRDTARAHHVNRTDINAVILLQRRVAVATACTRADDLCRIVLRLLFPARIQCIGEQIRLRAEQRLDALHQRRPVRPRHVEMPPEIEHGALAHPTGFAHRFHQPIGEIRLPVAPALDRGAANVHAAHAVTDCRQGQWPISRLWHYTAPCNSKCLKCMMYTKTACTIGQTLTRTGRHELSKMG